MKMKLLDIPFTSTMKISPRLFSLSPLSIFDIEAAAVAAVAPAAAKKKNLRRKSFLDPNRTSFLSSNVRFSSSLSSPTPVTPNFIKAAEYADRAAIVDSDGCHTYSQLLLRAFRFSEVVKERTRDSASATEPRVALLTPNDASYVVATWAAWMADCIVVPLHADYPVNVLRYYVDDAGVSLILAADSFRGLADDLAREVVKNVDAPSSDRELRCLSIPTTIESEMDHRADDVSFSSFLDDAKNRLVSNLYASQRALIIYTSGSTGPPKGVVVTHANLAAQMANMTRCWSWRPDDLILHVLPLHHVHGIVNCLYTPLNVGAAVHALPSKFDAENTLRHLTTPLELAGSSVYHSIFMAVPTIYVKLIEFIERTATSPADLAHLRDALSSRVRLMVSGSAALPTPVFDNFYRLSGHRLLERYGMTEIGMALSNPLKPARKRRPGAVGSPMPSVRVAIVEEEEDEKEKEELVAAADDDNDRLGERKEYSMIVECDGKSPKDVVFHNRMSLRDLSSTSSSSTVGQLYVAGPSVFTEYWNRPSATKDAFTADGRWFKTGDTAVVEDGVFKILGRTSVDIIKCGGYKISALDVERHLLSHPRIVDVAVVGVPDEEWGQIVAAVVVVKAPVTAASREEEETEKPLDLEELKMWAKDVMPKSWIPKIVINVKSIPRNAMGKVNKKTLIVNMFSC